MINFLKTGLLYADALTTVSRTYAREIQGEELGMGLHEVLRARADSLVGIVNGVDYAEWDPATDARLKHHFTAEDLTGKAENKRTLLEEFSLAPEPAGAARPPDRHRLTHDGPEGLRALARHPAGAACAKWTRAWWLLGSGEETYERYFQWLRDNFPDRVGVYHGYNEDLAHWIEAGSDLFLMPSRYEPCGLNQMYSLKYGTVPVVRRTGGSGGHRAGLRPGDR